MSGAHRQADRVLSPSATEPVPVSSHSGDAPLRVLDLFSGIGGFSLGLERTGGFETVAFCEIEDFPRRVLAKHWPGVPCYRDVRELTGERLAADGIAADVICGGFPCQDISFAGLGAGLDGERSGLFYEVARLIGELGPCFVILENVGALLSRGLDAVLGTLASIGYDAEWHCIPASHVGAPHQRDRVWIVAYPAPQRSAKAWQDSKRPAQRISRGAPVLAHTEGSEAWGAEPAHGNGEADFSRSVLLASLGGCDRLGGASDWHSEPAICRVADGISANVDRVAALGNAVVPQIPELIGRAILAQVDTPPEGGDAVAAPFRGSAVPDRGRAQ